MANKGIINEAAATTSANTFTELSTTAVSALATHTIAVGATGFTFDPDNITANVGDVVEFNFYPGNHSVARSAFKFPCIPFEDTGINLEGFFSGYRETNVYSYNGPKYRIRVNDSQPIFYYCATPGSCIGNHMIGVINPNATWTLESQEAYVGNTSIELAPGEPLTSESATSTASSSAMPRPTASATTTNSMDDMMASHAGGLPEGCIIGIVFGALAFISVAILGYRYFGKRKRPPSRRPTPPPRRPSLSSSGLYNSNGMVQYHNGDGAKDASAAQIRGSNPGQNPGGNFSHLVIPDITPMTGRFPVELPGPTVWPSDKTPVSPVSPESPESPVIGNVSLRNSEVGQSTQNLQ